MARWLGTVLVALGFSFMMAAIAILRMRTVDPSVWLGAAFLGQLVVTGKACRRSSGDEDLDLRSK